MCITCSEFQDFWFWSNALIKINRPQDKQTRWLNKNIKRIHELLIFYDVITFWFHIGTHMNYHMTEPILNCGYLVNILLTQPWLTRRRREISQGRTPCCASSTIRCLTSCGNGRPLTKTPPSWFTPPSPECRSRTRRPSSSSDSLCGKDARFRYLLCATVNGTSPKLTSITDTSKNHDLGHLSKKITS